MRTLIIDDETNSRRILRKLLAAWCPDVEVVGEAHSAASGIAAIEKHRPEIVFLDVQMPEGDGFFMLQQMPQIDFRVIFITAYDQYAIRAIRFSALDYLLKPINIADLEAAVERCRETQAGGTERIQLQHLRETTQSSGKALDRIVIPDLNEVHFVAISSIVRAEAEGNYTHVYTDDGAHFLVTHTLKEYDELLSGHQFFRVHHSHLINLKKVVKYIKGKGGRIVLSDGSEVDVSTRKKEEFLRLFQASWL